MYHVNPETGKFDICHASCPENCPFGVENHSESYEEIQIKADKINKTNAWKEKKEKKKEQLKEYQDKIYNNIQEIINSGRYKDYINMITRLSLDNRYSINNTCLILLQCPHASKVAGFQTWKKDFKRYVKKGEKAINILAPQEKKINVEQFKLDKNGDYIYDENGNKQTEKVKQSIIVYKTVPVFDVSQTDGEPLPEMATPIQRNFDNQEEYNSLMNKIGDIAKANNKTFEIDNLKGHNKESSGYYSFLDNSIHVRQGMSNVQTIKTSIHELAHSMLHNKTDIENREDLKDKTKEQIRRIEELEAETTAYIVCDHLNIDTSEYSFDYLSGWGDGIDKETFYNSIKNSFDLSKKIIEELK